MKISPKLNYWVDMLMFLMLVLTGLSGFLLGIFYKHFFLEVHEWSAIAVVALVILHLSLHAKWLILMTKNIFGSNKNETPKN